ncbi:aldehyde dehydrogenase family protein [Saccharopolyspora spinosa]|uniref:Betaine-aldehyde dehydrogenase n=1 Tax=Saccharopolyspora spinosa TaxID=60894 RepID=A0A2N3Y1H9_SACSN|nr:aldehyde dehydrogenase family protein [Saccharopolyspora spinosa]PKW16767.1 betaine-aldehyde dehydrogenase [Saccharopolyspora spinosa]
MTVSIERRVEVPHPRELFLGGHWTKPLSAHTIPVVSPIDGSVLCELPEVSRDDAARAIAAARAVAESGSWSVLSPADRANAVAKYLDELEAMLPQINDAWVNEVGVPAQVAVAFGGAMSLAGRDSIRLARELPFTEVRETAGGRVVVTREPLGPVLAILTYNGPTTEIGLSVIPALLVGNPVVIKLPPENRMVGHFLAEAAARAGLPEGLLSVVTAETEVSKYLVAHPDIAAVHFTGGTEIGGEVAATTAGRLACSTLELGGKSAAIVLDDADLDKTAPLLMAMTTFQGQICNALTRVLVSRTRYDEVVARLTTEFGRLKVGDPRDEETNFGPLPSERVRARAEGYIERAVAAGATVAFGGRRPAEFPRGRYLEPTLLTNVANSMEVAQNEIFGPVFCVIAYDDIEDAIRIANDSRFGLAGAVFTEDMDAAQAIAARVHVGTFWINATAPCLTAPYGGMKDSGHGRVGGPEGFFDLTEIKQIVVGP